MHVFGLEYYGSSFSETELQASLAGLSGATINSAYLNFSLATGSGGNESVQVTSFNTTGTLGFNAAAPNNLGTVTGAGIQNGANSIDVTSLVSAAVQANQTWLGLYLTPEGPGENYLFTETWIDPDAAGLEIVIHYTAANNVRVSVPESASTAVLLGIGMCLLSLGARKLKPQLG